MASRRALVLAVAAAIALPVPALWAAAVAAAPQTGGVPAPVPITGSRKPSIPAGEKLYVEACASCHADRARFAEATWRSTLSPGLVTSLLLGRTAGHPAALSDPARAWDAAAYVWTLPDSGQSIRRGESLAFDAEKMLRADALSVALLHWGDLQNLKSASWVLAHDVADVDALMYRLAGARYGNLTADDRRALIDYTFASFFSWPADW
jgi:mono/diheme cytochrome c family protein